MNECSKCESTYSVLTVMLETKEKEVVSRQSLCLKCLRAFRKENRQANLLRPRGKKLKITLDFSRSQTHAALNLRRGEYLAR
jgi:hypothetical protein